jgi:transcriptional regulator with XRE-family HTH domain
MDAPIDIRELRRALNWSQDDLARHLGVDRSTVSRMESGKEPSGPVKRILAQLIAKAS